MYVRNSDDKHRQARPTPLPLHIYLTSPVAVSECLELPWAGTSWRRCTERRREAPEQQGAGRVGGVGAPGGAELGGLHQEGGAGAPPAGHRAPLLAQVPQQLRAVCHVRCEHLVLGCHLRVAMAS